MSGSLAGTRCHLTTVQYRLEKSRLPILAAALIGILLVFSFGARALAAPGDLDPTFDGDGKKLINTGGPDVLGHALAVQSDGKILLVGNSNVNGGDFVAVRLTQTGALDAGFGSGGIALVNFGGQDTSRAVAIQASGKIVLAGAASGAFAVARLNSNGTLDTTFGTGGKTTVNVSGDDGAWAMALQTDDSIVIAGTSGAQGIVLRLTPNGALDTSFNSPNGYRIIGSALTAVAVQSDGKAVVGGHTGGTFLVARLLTSGVDDTSFNGSGSITGPIGGIIRSLAIQPDGKVLGGGGSGTSLAVARYTSSGAVDTGFNSPNGYATVSMGIANAINEGRKMALQADGRIVLGGYTNSGMNGDDFAIARLTSTGAIDTGFGVGGRVQIDLGSVDVLDALAIQADGKILAGGRSGTDFAAIRLEGAASGITAAADSYLRQGAANTNEGAATALRIQDSGNNRVLTRMDQAAIQAAVGPGTLVSAKLQFTIAANGNNWGTTGRTIDAHRLTAAWTEGNGFVDGGSPPNRGTGAGVTWNCATDSNIANQNDDCSGATAWDMNGPNPRPYVLTPTATVRITNGQSGVVEFDVTADVAAFLSGSAGNHGWVIRKTNEGAAGRVEFHSRETANGPRLILTVNP